MSKHSKSQTMAASLWPGNPSDPINRPHWTYVIIPFHRDGSDWHWDGITGFDCREWEEHGGHPETIRCIPNGHDSLNVWLPLAPVGTTHELTAEVEAWRSTPVEDLESMLAVVVGNSVLGILNQPNQTPLFDTMLATAGLS